jgi:hypothetical protein
MSDHIPNILVDNQKLQLISRHPAFGDANAAGTGLENDELDVVDRVTISDTAREHYRRYVKSMGAQNVQHHNDAGAPAAATIRPAHFPEKTS